MVNPVHNAIKAARGAHKGLAGVSLVLERGSEKGKVKKATVGETRVETIFEDGVVISLRMRDYLIDVADYAIAGEVTPPTQGDLVTQTVGGRSVVFQVLPAGSEREYRRSDREGEVWRVHTKEISGNEVTE